MLGFRRSVLRPPSIRVEPRRVPPTPPTPFGPEERFAEQLRLAAVAADQVVSLLVSGSAEPRGFTPSAGELAELRRLLTAVFDAEPAPGLPPGVSRVHHGEILLTDPFLDRVRADVSGAAAPADPGERLVIGRDWLWTWDDAPVHVPVGGLHRFLDRIVRREALF